jgi:hypothetical protein
MTVVVIAVLLSGWAVYRLQDAARYRCPVCGSRRPEDHARECPWSSGA